MVLVTVLTANTLGARATAALLGATMLAGVPVAATAQDAPVPAPSPEPTSTPAAAPTPPAQTPASEAATTAPAAALTAPLAPVAAPVTRTVKTLRVEGSQRIEPETVLSYTKLRVGQPYTNETLDQAIKDLFASDLFADVQVVGGETGDIVLRVRENPIINRVILEGNKRLKEDKITKEIKLKPRQIFTRTAVRQDVARIIELYRRQGRFAASVDPKMVALDQNRVDVVFEISEGPKSKVRQINVIGNEVFSDDKLREQMATKQARFFRLLSGNTSYDQDRLAYDQQKLRQFYLTEGYADFRVTSAVAELTPDKKDFIITYVVEEGPRYKFGDVSVDSDIRDFDDKRMSATLPIHKGDWYNAKTVEDTVESLSNTTGLFGYAFTEVNPEFNRNKDALTMSINFHIAQSQRTYVERINVTGNTQTQDKVVRREIRLSEGDAFNSFQLKRSQDRINSLGYFQDKFEIKQTSGSSPDRIVLDANVEEKSTGTLQLSAGFSSLERFIVQANITQANFRGKGQELRLGANYSSYSKSLEAGFTEPYLFDRNIAVGIDLFRRDYNAFNYIGTDRNTTYSQTSTGFQIRAGVPLTEYISLSARYGLTYDDVGLDRQYFVNGQCDILIAGRYLCEALGKRLTSSVGYSLIYDSLNSRLRPTRGQRLSFSQDFAGVGGDVKYLRTTAKGEKYWGLGKSGFVLSALGESGYIVGLGGSPGPGIDSVRITDRFYLGEPQFRGFDIRGVGPRIQRTFYSDGSPNQILRDDKDQIVDDALGGKAYYLGRLELEIPLSAGARELGLRPSIYVQAGSLFSIKQPRETVRICPVDESSATCDGFPTLRDPTGKTYVGSLFRQQFDGAGNPLFTYTTTDPTTNLPQTIPTTCAAGIPDSTGACIGTIANPQAQSEVTPFIERFLGDTPRPRLSVGIGVNWNSPFGPLRIDVAKALLSQPGDDTKLITFNVGTQF